MKRISILLSVALLGTLLITSSCRKPKDPCEGVRCEEGYKCVEGKCVPIRKG